VRVLLRPTPRIPVTTSISDFMVSDHRRCDDALARAAQAAAGDDWSAACAAFEAFHAAITRHIAAEEELLFPAFESATGRSALGGPTEIMRVEHEQLRDVFDWMTRALASREADLCRELHEALFALLLQHNVKEERMLYPMLDRALAKQAGELVGRCRELGVLSAR
jgi:hemerythrin-like domain-containing protein